ncbi:hypothetical protein [Olleya namhaensis]|uniref:hypothetical protein n=1 Tax=Olleya namhaensis TaxID=1144750 RepID=UPI0024906E09|nr:hypothetical protein [Olleya namhaensis]
MHVFYAQGGGLGHLTRTDKLIKSLNIPLELVVIISPSHFTGYFKNYQFIKLAWSDTPSTWTKQITEVIKKLEITSFYIDTFPFGLKGELCAVYKGFPNVNYTYVARVLKWETYLKAMPQITTVNFSETLILEKLYNTHLEWITNHSTHTTNLTLKSSSITPIAFLETPYVMVVHSGGQADVLHIIARANTDYKSDQNMKIVVFTQVDIQLKQKNVIIYKDRFPVSQYYKHATKIYTAAGFNSIQELKKYINKHVIIPFEKLYDDQFFRVSNSL